MNLIFVKRPSAIYPAVDVNVTETRYLDHNCGSCVAGPNLNGWEWKVQARGIGGSVGPWSETRVFSFAPSMLTRRSSCGG